MTVRELREAIAKLDPDEEVFVREFACPAPFHEPNDDGPGVVLYVPDAGTYGYSRMLQKQLRDLRVSLETVLGIASEEVS